MTIFYRFISFLYQISGKIHVFELWAWDRQTDGQTSQQLHLVPGC